MQLHPLTRVLGELLNHWQQFQRLQRAIAVLQVETSKIQKDRISTTSLCPKNDSIQTINCKIYLPSAATVEQCVSIHASNLVISVGCSVSLSNWVKKFKHVCSKVSLESSSTRACGWKPDQVNSGSHSVARCERWNFPKFHFCPNLENTTLRCAARLVTTLWLQVPATPRDPPSLWKEWQNFPNHFRAFSCDFGPTTTGFEADVYMVSFHVQTCISQLRG